jgi:predicted AlkP superfamily phosphohydrolase/phosphomutase
MVKLILLGLDGCSPEEIYRHADELPNFKRVMDAGGHGINKSVVPPITPHAWTTVFSGKNPGMFGYWDFNYRTSYTYTEDARVTSMTCKEPRLHNILPEHGLKMGLAGIPVSTPPLYVPNDGFCIADFLTGTTKGNWISPVEMGKEVIEQCGDWIFDASTVDENFRKMEKTKLIRRITDMDAQRFKLFKYLHNKYDFLAADCMGTDRMGHLFWSDFDPQHVRYKEGSPFKDAYVNHLKFLDKNLGELMSTVGDLDKTNILIMSDHNVQRLDGRVNINEWLIEKGYMKLKPDSKVDIRTPLGKLPIDWSKTVAWGTGYQGQIFLNVKGREKFGIVDPNDYDSTLDEIIEELMDVPDEKGNKIKGTKITKRKDVYKGPYANLAPDLFLFIGAGHWGVNERVGYGSTYSYDTLLGQDDGIHGEDCTFMMAGPSVPHLGEIKGGDLLDIAPTMLDILGVPIPGDFEGKTLIKKK